MTKQLTKNQIDFITSNYFDINVKTKPIAEKLVSTGKCVVYDTERIWHGSIGNYIDVSKCDDGPNLYLYTFKLDMFLESEHYKLTTQNHMVNLVKKKEDLESKINEINSIF